MRRAYRLFSFFVYILAVLICASYLYYPLVLQWVKGQIIHIVEQGSPFRIRMRSFQAGQLWSQLFFDDLVVEMKEPFIKDRPETQLVLEIPLLSVKFNWWRFLFHQELVLDVVSLYIRKINVVRNEQGHVNLEYLFRQFYRRFDHRLPDKKGMLTKLSPLIIRRLYLEIQSIDLIDGTQPTTHTPTYITRTFYKVTHLKQLVFPLLDEISPYLTQFVFDAMIKNILESQKVKRITQNIPWKEKLVLRSHSNSTANTLSKVP